MAKKDLAVITLDNNDGSGFLYWRDGAIWLRRASDDTEVDTKTICLEESEALAVIEDQWGHEDWKLRLFQDYYPGAL